MFSVHSYLKKGAIDNYDTIFCVGQHHVDEIREIEKVCGLKPKILINYGFGRLDTLLQEKENFKKIIALAKKSYLILLTPPMQPFRREHLQLTAQKFLGLNVVSSLPLNFLLI